MSRALDKHVIAALKQGDHEKIFQAISGLLVQQEDDRLLEIEILGRSHPIGPDENYLRDDNAVAIPKLRLVQAFLVARSILQTHLEGGPVESNRLRSATCALLLMDPEHLTAANTRKRLLQDELSAASDPSSVLRREKWFVDSLLTSRLHRHTKSPTLWSHRRWLAGQMRTANMTLAIPQDVEDVIMIAAERHPRNYYAWSHARWLTKTFRATCRGEELMSLILGVKKWCFRHHTDVSGWSFLVFLLAESQAEDDCQALKLVFKETLDLADSLRWANESVWWFLRTTASCAALSSTGREDFNKIQERLAATIPQGSVETQVLQTAREWCELYGR
ncbi:hypothetical protein CPLU01_12524 [Colletotrichum plurivorum]|uniref:Protein prenyltransferase n=1 Tax=Colletotrichum plurivorum TaxID=2175906 RepID=A0A8H6N6K0_9PEZI|nr:hypothetical protein CPLU01_12524 [Colletotrichum plurivorum]